MLTVGLVPIATAGVGVAGWNETSLLFSSCVVTTSGVDTAVGAEATATGAAAADEVVEALGGPGVGTKKRGG